MDTSSSAHPSARDIINHDERAEPSAPPDPQPPDQVANTTLRHRPHAQSTEEYLRRRIQEDQQGGEAGLLPLKSRVAPQKPKPNDRDELLRGSGAGIGMGSAQLHEELGGQLADVRVQSISCGSRLTERCLIGSSSTRCTLQTRWRKKKHCSTHLRMFSKVRPAACTLPCPIS